MHKQRITLKQNLQTIKKIEEGNKELKKYSIKIVPDEDFDESWDV